MKRIQSSISSYFTGPQQKVQRKNITEDETRSDIADRMVDSSISLAEESSQAEGSLSNPSPPETKVGGCIEPFRFAKWRRRVESGLIYPINH